MLSNQHNRLPQSEREKLIEQVVQATRENSTTTIFFHTAIAEQIGLSATEEKTLLILSSQGPLTAGEIAQHTGLTTSSVTSLIDRLESKGFVRRVHDSRDRRRVIVEPIVKETNALEMSLFGSIQEEFADFLDVYSDEQLATIVDFMKRATRYSQKAIAALKTKESK